MLTSVCACVPGTPADGLCCAMADEPKRGGINLEAFVASMMALLALLVSAYTAWIQRQQVRAQVMPILEVGTSNTPSLHFSVQNKGAGPARIEHAVVTIDGKPIHDWSELHRTFFRADEKASFSTSLLVTSVLSPGEEIDVYTLIDKEGNPIPVGRPGTPGYRFNKDRFRVGVRICFCSTLDDCWTLERGMNQWPTMTPTRRCPARDSADSFTG